MPLRIVRVPTGPTITNPAKARQLKSNALTRIAKRFKASQKEKMAKETHTGRVYSRPGITGASRFHQASARRERPAIDTGTLLNAIEDQKIGADRHEVLVNDSKAPYGKYLVAPRLDRVIMSDKDIHEFEVGEMKQEVDRLADQLFG